MVGRQAEQPSQAVDTGKWDFSKERGWRWGYPKGRADSTEPEGTGPMAAAKMDSGQ